MSNIEANQLLLVLNNHPNVGAQTIKKALAAFDDQAGQLWAANNAQIEQRLGPKVAALIIEAKKVNPTEIIEKLSELGIGYLTMLDKEYPSLLKEIPDYPAVLYIKGNYSALSESAIAVVGSRKYSGYGARVARSMARDLCQSGLCIVSGLALGIDAIAHHSAVENNCHTVAVLGCGLDSIYPVSNIGLAKKIIETGGAIITEYPPGTIAFKGNFPARNRIIAGLSLGTLVVEAARESGALITALAALDYNREVYAIPGPIDSEFSEGCNYLIQQGAKLIQNSSEILSDLNIDARRKQQKAKEILIENKEEREIIKIIGSEGKQTDEIVRELKLNVARISYALTMLEMKGMLENVNGVWRKKI